MGFLPWNFYPARIFMGDSGSMLLGMLLTIATISGVARNPFPPSGGDLAAVVGTVMVPLLVLAIPFLDVVLAVIRRTWRGKGIGTADKEHIHHRLLDIGHSHRSAVLLMYLWSALISASALAIGLIDGRLAVGVIITAAVVLFAVTALPRLARWRGRAEAAAEPVPSEAPAAAGRSRRPGPFRLRNRVLPHRSGPAEPGRRDSDVLVIGARGPSSLALTCALRHGGGRDPRPAAVA